jgi:hypothetical protein
MDMDSDITAAAFAAYLKCPRKSYLTLHGERPSDALAGEMWERISTAYKTRCKRQLQSELTDVVPLDFGRLAEKPACEASTLLVDCETAFYVRDDPTKLAGNRRHSSLQIHRDVIPIVYYPWGKADPCAEFLLSFGALAIAQATGRSASPTGKVIYGENLRIRNVKINSISLKRGGSSRRSLRSSRLENHHSY